MVGIMERTLADFIGLCMAVNLASISLILGWRSVIRRPGRAAMSLAWARNGGRLFNDCRQRTNKSRLLSVMTPASAA
jgi:hypothetical protein